VRNQDSTRVDFPLSINKSLTFLPPRYVDPKTRYPPGWAYDGKDDIRPAPHSIESTWHAMEKLVDSGLSRSIGISNTAGVLIMDMLRYARIRPATLQIEHHPYLTQPALLELATREGIAVTAYSSFGPQSFVELKWKKALDTPLLFENPKVMDISQKHGKTPAQVLLRWATQRGVAIIPKSNSQERLRQNLEASTGFDLTPSELEEISSLDRNLRFNDPWDVSHSFHTCFAVSVGRSFC
jgi:D-xylose reductase